MVGEGRKGRSPGWRRREKDAQRAWIRPASTVGQEQGTFCGANHQDFLLRSSIEPGWPCMELSGYRRTEPAMAAGEASVEGCRRETQKVVDASRPFLLAEEPLP